MLIFIYSIKKKKNKLKHGNFVDKSRLIEKKSAHKLFKYPHLEWRKIKPKLHLTWEV